MKALSFNQIQACIIFLIFILFSTAIVSYRVFVEYPLVESALKELILKERQVLRRIALNYQSSLKSINYDYAAWDQTYEFVQTKSQTYIDENFVEDTFTSLEIDGIFVFRPDLSLVFAKGFHNKEQIPLDFEFYDFERFPKYRDMFIRLESASESYARSGIINTKYGPALYNVTEIKKSDNSGVGRGYLVFLKLFSDGVGKKVEELTMTKTIVEPISVDSELIALPSWTDPVESVEIQPSSQLVIKDIWGQPLLLLTMQHESGKPPPLFDKQSVTFVLFFVVFILISYFLIANIIIKPVKKLTFQIKSIGASSSQSNISNDFRIKELESVANHFNSLMDRVARQKDMLSQQAMTDALTSIGNRRRFETYFEKQTQFYARSGSSFAVLIADIDHFKLFNDNLGHLIGDDVLVTVAKTLDMHFRRVNDLCARYGGEEFVMIFSEIDEQGLQDKLQDILASIEALEIAHPFSPTSPLLTISIGACLIDDTAEKIANYSQKDVLEAADSALYLAKNEGRNRYKYITYEEFISAKTD